MESQVAIDRAKHILSMQAVNNARRQAVNTVKLEIKDQVNNMNNNENNLLNRWHKKSNDIKQKTWFFKIHFFLVILSFVIPGILSFYDSNISIMQRATNAVTIPLVLCHSFINIITIFGNIDTSSSSRNNYKYLIGWFSYEFIKIMLIVIHLASPSSFQNIQFKLTFAVLLFLICEGIHFFASEFEIPKAVVTILSQHLKKLFWIAFMLLMTVYVFSYVAYVMFSKIVNEAAQSNAFIEGKEFNNIIDSVITMLDIKDWWNSYLIRAIEDKLPGSIIFFMIYVFLVRHVWENLLLVSVVAIFTNPATEKLILSK